MAPRPSGNTQVLRALTKRVLHAAFFQLGPLEKADLKVDSDIGRYCPDRDILEELYRRTLELWNRENEWRDAPEVAAKLTISGPLQKR